MFTLLVLAAPARADHLSPPHPPSVFVAQALCIHSGWHYTPLRQGRASPGYVLWGHGYWRTWKTWANGEGAWNATSDPRYGGGMSFTLGTWNRAGPDASSTHEIARATPSEQIRRAWVIWKQGGGSWQEWPTTSRACGYR